MLVNPLKDNEFSPFEISSNLLYTVLNMPYALAGPTVTRYQTPLSLDNRLYSLSCQFSNCKQNDDSVLAGQSD